MKALSLTINGRSVQAQIEPRLNLADFLRDHQALTATHIGCEHGVCGACTVWIDGAPARSCITFAAAANGAQIMTLEGFEKDPVMDLLREAFAENHGLQCGFCTPGMLMTGRDILTRLPDADEKRIRLELSGGASRPKTSTPSTGDRSNGKASNCIRRSRSRFHAIKCGASSPISTR